MKFEELHPNQIDHLIDRLVLTKLDGNRLTELARLALVDRVRLVELVNHQDWSARGLGYEIIVRHFLDQSFALELLRSISQEPNDRLIRFIRRLLADRVDEPAANAALSLLPDPEDRQVGDRSIADRLMAHREFSGDTDELIADNQRLIGLGEEILLELADRTG